MWCTRRSVGAREVDISLSSNGGRHPKWLAGIDEKPVSSGGCRRLRGQANGGLGGKAGSENSQSQSRASLHIPDGLIRHALSIADDGSVSFRGLRPFRAEVGEFELVIVLYVLCSGDYLAARTISSTDTSPRSLVCHTGTNLSTLWARMSSRGYHLESSGGSSI